MGKSTRTTISVPAELKARMDAVDELVNWSALACAAFEHKLAEIITRRGASDMKDVISRLRASKQKTESALYTEGHAAGKRWAETTAEAEELERLSGQVEMILRDHHEDSWPATLIEGSAYGADEHFYSMIEGTDVYRDAGSEFWEDVVGPDGNYHEPEFIRGFADGALKVWDAVKDEL